MSRLCKKNGFTIIELTLAMTFLSILLVMITMMVIRVGDIYNRGLTIKDVNQAGRVIIRDLQQTIAQSRSFDVASGKNFVQTEYGGRLCTGQYSYIWNYAKTITHPSSSLSADNANLDKSTPEGKMMRFIKVPDSTSNYCLNSTNDLGKKIAVSSVQDLLGTDDLTLALYDFSITQSAFDSKTGQGLYYVSFTVGTDSAAAADKDAISCTPDNDQLDISYCSVNQFNMVVRAGNEIQY